MGRIGITVSIHALVAVQFILPIGELCGNLHDYHSPPACSLLAWGCFPLTQLPLSSVTVLVAGVLGWNTGRLLLDTCNGQPYSPSQYICLVLPGELYANSHHITAKFP